MQSMEQRRLICSVIFYALAITCVIWSLYVLIDRVMVDSAASDKASWQFWTKLVVIMIGIIGGGIFTYVQGRLYYDLLERWCLHNQYYTVQEPPPEAMLKIRLERRAPCGGGTGLGDRPGPSMTIAEYAIVADNQAVTALP